MAVPPPIRGLGQANGFQMMVEDRQGLGYAELRKVTQEIIAAGNAQPRLRNLASTFSLTAPSFTWTSTGPRPNRSRSP